MIKIREIENQKGELLSLLTQKDSYKKFKEYQRKTVSLEVEVERIDDKIQAIENQNVVLENDKKTIPVGGSYREELLGKLNLL